MHQKLNQYIYDQKYSLCSFGYSRAYAGTLAVFLENPEWNSHKSNEQQPHAFICTTKAIILSFWSIMYAQKEKLF